MRVDGDTTVDVEVTESERQVMEEAEPGEDEENANAERARRDRMKSVPRPPSVEEQRLHRATHCPYRSWCPCCVAGRGQAAHVQAGQRAQAGGTLCGQAAVLLH